MMQQPKKVPFYHISDKFCEYKESALKMCALIPMQQLSTTPDFVQTTPGPYAITN